MRDGCKMFGVGGCTIACLVGPVTNLEAECSAVKGVLPSQVRLSHYVVEFIRTQPFFLYHALFKLCL